MKRVWTVFLAVSFMLGIAGCSDAEKDIIKSENTELICESTISPNEKYVKSDEDKVVQEIKVYQKKDNTIIVNAKANTEFFDEMQYKVEYDKDISDANVNIEWTTLMGNSEATKEDQKVIASVKILENNEVISERKINFAKKAMDIVVDSINKK